MFSLEFRDMQIVVITILKDTIATSMETLLWKYGSSIESAENFKLVYNTKSSRAKNAVDARVIDDAWETRTQEAIDFLRDFAPDVNQTAGSKVVTLSMSSRWRGSQSTLKAAMEKYILDGMMADWLNTTAPTEAAIYATRLQQDTENIITELYTKGAPQ